MADEDTPYRLDRSMAEAKAAVGVPNAKREIDKLGRTPQSTVVLDDVSHLAPVSIVPRFFVSLTMAPVAGQFAAIELFSPTRPWSLELVEISVTNNFGELYTVGPSATDTVALPRATGAVTAAKVIHPAEDISPKTVQWQGGSQAVTLSGAFIEQNRIYEMGLIVPAGKRIGMELNVVTTTLDVSFIIQEYPAGIGYPQP